MSEQLERIGPTLILFGVALLAVVLGLINGSTSTQIINTGPWQLHPSYQGIYVQAVADAYALDNNQDLAANRLSFLCQADGSLTNAFTEAEQRYPDPTKQANLNSLRGLVDSERVTANADVGVCNTGPVDKLARSGRLISMIAIIVMFLAIVGYGVLQIINASEAEATSAKPAYTPPASVGTAASAPPTTAPKPAGVPAPGAPAPPPAAPAAPPRPAEEEEKSRGGGLLGLGRKKEDEPVTLDTAKSAAQAGAVLSASAEKTNFEAMGADPPLVQFMTTYLHGDELYDDSFSVETSSGEFLGETGIGISESIEQGDTKYVAGLEIWLFDKNDIRTVTKVLMSDHAFNDEATRARLAPKGEAVLANPGDKLTLETASLRVQARVVDFAYGSAPGVPPNGFFERVTIELAAWKKKEGEAASAPPGIPTPPGG